MVFDQIKQSGAGTLARMRKPHISSRAEDAQATRVVQFATSACAPCGQIVTPRCPTRDRLMRRPVHVARPSGSGALAAMHGTRGRTLPAWLSARLWGRVHASPPQWHPAACAHPLFAAASMPRSYLLDRIHSCTRHPRHVADLPRLAQQQQARCERSKQLHASLLRLDRNVHL